MSRQRSQPGSPKPPRLEAGAPLTRRALEKRLTRVTSDALNHTLRGVIDEIAASEVGDTEASIAAAGTVQHIADAQTRHALDYEVRIRYRRLSSAPAATAEDERA